LAAALLLLLALPGVLPVQGKEPTGARPVPVIYDTDIGDDIDDTWALGFLLRSPELDLKLAVGDNGKAHYRAKLLAKFLQRAGRSDVPVGIGLEVGDKKSARQGEWVRDYDLKSYPGKVSEDGVQAIIDTIMHSPEPVIIIAVGPVQNIAEALRREPGIARRSQFVGMHGSVRVGYGGEKKPSPEYNVREDAKACQAVFTAPWKITITPLDTCDRISLRQEKYQRVLKSKDPIATDIIANYRMWAIARGKDSPKSLDTSSTTLFDTVAVYLAFSRDWCNMEELGIRVTDDGFTVEDPAAKKVNAAMSWKDLAAFEDLLVQRLTLQKP